MDAHGHILSLCEKIKLCLKDTIMNFIYKKKEAKIGIMTYFDSHDKLIILDTKRHPFNTIVPKILPTSFPY